MKASVIAGAVSLALFATNINAEPERVALPEGYQNRFDQYSIINRPKKKEVVYCYANKVAIDSAIPGDPLAPGSVLVMEVYKAQLDEKGEPVSNDSGLYIKDSLAAIVVMEKQEGWGAAFPENIRNGDWDYSKYKPGKEAPVNKESTECLECHKLMWSKDFVFSFDDLASAKK